MTPAEHPSHDGTPAIVSLRTASFGYADRAVVAGVTLDIHASEVVAILGPNGSGKSTLVKGLLGLNDHLGGEVSLFGTPIRRFREHARLGYVPQRHTLSASVRATAAEIVAIGRLPHQGWLGRPNQQDRQIIADSLAVVGLGDRAKVDVNTLSGGQQRRVLIARALAAQPDVLIMDEPTAGVDQASQEVLSQVIARLARSGVTMLIVTHELQAIRSVLTRIVQVNGGRVSFDGSPADHARSHGAPPSGHDGHHHDDEELPVSSPTAGPFDRFSHLPGGHSA
ncbi:MAG: zinc transport system ATP-binding protein [Actinomycetota bacterium]|nr:zinc transport system ATP-binding protein [Actinomycetota bacterium]